MCGYQDALSNIMPIDWLDPYGRTPFAKDAEMSVDITIVETDDGIRATSVKNPPQAGPSRMINAIKNALGVGMIDSLDPCSSQQADDQGKCDSMINNDKKKESQDNSEKSQDSDIMKPSSSGGSGHRDRNPGSQGSRPEPSRYGATEDEDAKDKGSR